MRVVASLGLRLVAGQTETPAPLVMLQKSMGGASGAGPPSHGLREEPPAPDGTLGPEEGCPELVVRPPPLPRKGRGDEAIGS